MMKTLKYSALTLALALGSSTLALAHDHHRDPDNPGNNVAPEIDPGVAFGSLSLLGGTLMVVRSRRRKS
jgi:hypothetical protein